VSDSKTQPLTALRISRARSSSTVRTSNETPHDHSSTTRDDKTLPGIAGRPACSGKLGHVVVDSALLIGQI